MFDNLWTPDDKYSLSVKVSVYRNQFKWSFLQNLKYFHNFFLRFSHLHKIFNILKKKMSLIADLFLKL